MTTTETKDAQELKVTKLPPSDIKAQLKLKMDAIKEEERKAKEAAAKRKEELAALEAELEAARPAWERHADNLMSFLKKANKAIYNGFEFAEGLNLLKQAQREVEDAVKVEVPADLPQGEGPRNEYDIAASHISTLIEELEVAVEHYEFSKVQTTLKGIIKETEKALPMEEAAKATLS